MIGKNVSVIMQLMMLFCVTWVIEFTWTLGDFFDMMISVYDMHFFLLRKTKCIKLSHLSVIN